MARLIKCTKIVLTLMSFEINNNVIDSIHKKFGRAGQMCNKNFSDVNNDFIGLALNIPRLVRFG